MASHSLDFPLLSPLSDLLPPSVISLLISVTRWLTFLAATAAAAAHGNADKDGSTHHSQGNNEGLKVQPTHSPAGLGQLAEGSRRQQPAHRVVSAVVAGEAPQALGM